MLEHTLITGTKTWSTYFLIFPTKLAAFSSPSFADPALTLAFTIGWSYLSTNSMHGFP